MLGLPTVEEALAPGLGLTLLSEIVADDGDGKVGPGERVRYTGTLSNPGDATTTGVSFAIQLDPNLTIDSATILFAPIAIDDAYATDTDTPLVVTVGTGGTLSANDFDLDHPLPKKAVTPATAQATTQGGTVDITNRGGFTYTPPSGFSGTDTFTYVLTDRDGATDTGTATIEVGSEPPIPGVWFVDDDAAPGGDGSLSHPFQSHLPLAGAGGAGDVDEPGHTIYFLEGTYDIGQTFELEANQKVIGQGVDLVIDGNVIVAGSPAQQPVVTHSGGANIILADGVELVGFDVGSSASPVAGTGLDGSAGGIASLTVDAMAIHTNGGPAVRLVGGVMDIALDAITTANATGAALDLTNVEGTFGVTGTSMLGGGLGAVIGFNANGGSATFGLLDIDATAGGGLTMTGPAGSTVSVGGTTSTIDATGGPAINVSSGPTLSGTFASLSSASSFGPGLFLTGNGHTLAVTGTTTISGSTTQGLFIQSSSGSSFTFGATTITGGTDGILLDGNGATPFSFGDTDISGSSGRGLFIRNAGGTYTFAAGSSIANTTGNALDVEDGAMTVGFDGSITNSSGRAIRVSNNNTAVVTVGGTVTDTGTGIEANGGASSANLTLNGNLDLDTTTNTGLTAINGGTVNVNGASNAITTTTASAISCNGSTLNGTFHDVDVTAGTATGISLVSCLGTKTLVDFDAVTSAATGLFANSGGTLQVTGMSGSAATSTIAATNAVAVNLQSTTVGAAGVRFRSLSSSNATAGLILNGTGNSGVFEVTGDGASSPAISVGTRGRTTTGTGGPIVLGSGGTFSGMSGDGVQLTNANDVRLRNLVLSNSTDNGIEAATVSGLVLDNVRLDGAGTHGLRGTGLTALTILNSELINAGNAVDEDAVNVIGLFGDSFVTNTVIDEHHSQGIFVSNATRTSAITPDRLMVQNSIVTDSDLIDGAVAIEYNSVSPTIPLGTALSNFSLHVTDSEIRRVEGNGILVAPQGQTGDKAHVEVRRTTIVGSGAAANVQVPSAVQVNPNLNGSATFVIADNPNFTDLATTAVILKNDSNGSLEGYVTNNIITARGQPFAITGDGASGATLVAGRTVVSMTGNTMTGQIGGNGAQISAQDNTGVTTDVTYQNNSLTANGVNGSGLAIDAQGAGNTTCVNYTNNTINAPGMFESVGIFPLSGGAVRLQGMAGNTAANATAYIDGQTNEVPPTPNSFAFATGGGTFGSATCATPGFSPFALTAAAPETKTERVASVEVAPAEKAPMPRAETRQPTDVAFAPRREAVRLGRLVDAHPSAPASGPEAEEVTPSVEFGPTANLAGGTFTFTIHDLPAGVSSTFRFEGTTGQTIKASALATTVTVTAVNASTVSETATTSARPSREVTDNYGAGWRTYGIPAEDFTVADLAQFNLVQCIPGYYENQGICNNQPGVNLYTSYNGTALVPASGPTEEIQRGYGIYWYLFDATFDPNAPNPGPSPSQSYELPMTLSAGGPVPPGDVPVALHANGDRWNLLANPFPRDLDVTNLGSWATGGTLTSAIGQIWNPVKNTFTLTSQKGNKLAAWQGAFFRNQTATGLTFMASAQVDDAQFIGKAPVAEVPQRGVSFELASETPEGVPLADEAISLAFDATAHPGRDRLDVDKLAPPLASFALGAFENEDGDLLAQHALPHELDHALAIPLHILATGTSGTHTLSWPRVEDVPASWTLRLVDRETGAEVDLRESEAYTFQVADGSPEAAGEERTGTSAGKSASVASPDLPAFRPTVQLPEAIASLTGGASGARFLVVVGPGEVDLGASSTRDAVRLDGAFPNPFGTSTALRYVLPEAALVRLAAYDVLGREVAVLVEAEQSAGTHTAAWSPRGLAAGTYVVRLRVQTDNGPVVERSLRVTHSR